MCVAGFLISGMCQASKYRFGPNTPAEATFTHKAKEFENVQPSTRLTGIVEVAGSPSSEMPYQEGKESIKSIA